MITRLLQLFTSWLNCSAMKRTVLIGSLSGPYCIIWTAHELLSAIRFFNSLHSRRLQEFNSSFDWLTGMCVFCDWTERLLWFWCYETQLKTAQTPVGFYRRILFSFLNVIITLQSHRHYLFIIWYWSSYPIVLCFQSKKSLQIILGVRTSYKWLEQFRVWKINLLSKQKTCLKWRLFYVLLVSFAAGFWHDTQRFLQRNVGGVAWHPKKRLQRRLMFIWITWS